MSKAALENQEGDKAVGKRKAWKRPPIRFPVKGMLSRSNSKCELGPGREQLRGLRMEMSALTSCGESSDLHAQP